MPPRSPLLLIVSSPSGAGKSTLCHRLLAEFEDVRFSVSHTTRVPRRNEVDGVDYHFIDDAAFDEMVREDRFIEWAHVHGNRYGTAHDEIRAASERGVDLVFDVDYQGAARIKTCYPQAVGVFVLPPNIEELRRRLRARGTETQASLDRRFEAALDEIGHHGEFDYLLVNDVLDEAYDKLRAVLISQRIAKVRATHLALRLLGS